AHFGPEAKDAREQLKLTASHIMEVLWSDAGRQETQVVRASTAGEQLYDQILSLKATTDSQKTIQNQAISIAMDIGQTRWLLYQQAGSSIPTLFIILLVFWFSVTFFSIGLFAPVNAMVLATLLLCAVSVAGGVFLVLELDHPFSGLIQISPETLRNAITQLGR